MMKITKHSLAKGAKFPETTKGLLRLYNMRFCPYAERCVLVLAAKNIPHEMVNLDTSEKPEWYAEVNPEGKVPALDKDGQILSDSLIVSDYLDDAFSENPLHPKDPFQKAKNNLLVLRFNNKIGNACFPFFSFKTENASGLWENILKDLEFFEAEANQRGTKFLYGNDKPGMVDYAIWPWFERFAAFEVLHNIEGVPPNRFPKLAAWTKNMLADPAVQKVALPPKLISDFFKTKETGKLDFDLGL